MTSPGRIAAACGVLVAVFVVALLVGRGSGDSGQNAAASAEVEALKLPDNSMRAPKLQGTGTIPDLHSKPVETSTPSASSTPTASGPSSTSSTGSTQSTGGSSGGGGGATPPAPVPR